MDIIGEKLNEYISSGFINGAACTVRKNSNVLYENVLGFSDCDKRNRLEKNAIFRLASMTKPVTACAVMLCREKGLLDLDESVGKYLDFNHRGVGKIENEKVVFSHTAREITLRDILSHSSGLGSGMVGEKQRATFGKNYTLKECSEKWNGSFLDFAPRTAQAYSAVTAFEIAARIVEKVVDMPYENFIKESIFLPLNMNDTCYSLNEEQKTRLVELGKSGENGFLKKVDIGVRGFGEFPDGYVGGSAGLFSTLCDYASFAQMLSQNGKVGTKRILSEDSVKQIRTAQLPKDLNGLSECFNWGLGVRVCEKRGERQPLPEGSFGWSGAYGTHFWIEPLSDIYAVLMVNKSDIGGSGSVVSAEFEKSVECFLNN